MNSYFTNWYLSNISDNLPDYDIIKNEDSFDIIINVPGHSKEDILIEYDNGELKVSSTKNFEDYYESNFISNYRKDISKFESTFSVPHKYFDADLIKAECMDGILKLKIPKKIDKEIKKIEIS